MLAIAALAVCIPVVPKSEQPVGFRLDETLYRPGTCDMGKTVFAVCTSPITGRTLVCMTPQVSKCFYPGRDV